MTLDVTVPARRRISRKKARILIALAVLTIGLLAYVAKYEYCNFHSKFCVLGIAGTRSEIGVEWESWSLYVSTSGNDPATHVLIG